MDELGGVFTPSVVELQAGLVDVESFVSAWHAEDQEADLSGGAVRADEVGAVVAVAIAERGVWNEAELRSVLFLQADHQVEVGHRIGLGGRGLAGYGQVPEGQSCGFGSAPIGARVWIVGPTSFGAIVMAVQT